MTEEIKKLSDYSHIRLRTELYLSSRSPHEQTTIDLVDNKLVPVNHEWTPAVFTAWREILDNALDEVVGHGHGSKITIDYNPTTFEFCISDDGRGIPFDWDSDHSMHKATLAMSEPRAGRNFGDRAQVAGMNGVGASVVNMCSEWFEIDILRDNQRFKQRFEESPEIFDYLTINKPKIKTLSSPKTGTTVRWKLSSRVFKSMKLPETFVKSRVTELAAINPKIKFIFNGEKIPTKNSLEKTLFENKKPIKILVEARGFESLFLVDPYFAESGEYIHSLVNNIPTFNGGTHIETFKKFFYSNLLDALEREGKKRSLTPNRSDVSEGLLIFNVTKMNNPNFDSQSKTRLINEEVVNMIKSQVDNGDLYKKILNANRDWVEKIFERCEARTMKKDMAEINKAAKKLLRAKVPKLMDANSKDRSNCILFVVEGDSGKGGVVQVRNPEIHGALPLRGKIMNVRGESPKKILENQILQDLMSSIGLVLGQTCDRSQLRYGKVYFATDQDPDGFNIGALLTNFFFLHWPELFDPKLPAFFYAFQTPFIIAEKGNQRKYWYAHDYNSFDSSSYKGWSITRAKGLGSLQKEDWSFSLTNPIATPLVNDGNLSSALDLIFNPDRANDRRDWIAL